MGQSFTCGCVAAGLIIAATPRTAWSQPVTTILTHGYSLNGEKGAWVEGMGDAIIQRAGGTGAVLRLDQGSGVWELLSGSLDAGEPIVLIFRWLDDFEKTGPDLGFAEGAGDALYAALRDPVFADGGGPLPPVDLIDGRWLHFVGHSRGPCVNSEAVRRLGAAGITVDHVTTLDPHPVNGTLDAPFFNFDWGDPLPQKWSNVTWEDNYWRADGGGIVNCFDFDGIPLPGVEDVELDEDALSCCAYGFSHSDTHLWYHGTIDTTVTPEPGDGEQTITQQMRQTWWPEGFTQRGYYYSVIGGGSAFRPAQPAGVDPGQVAPIYGGSFEQAGYAGWLYHGGAVDGPVVDEGGHTFVKLGTGFGALARHNRFFLPPDAQAVSLDYTIIAADSAADDRLVAFLTDRDGADWALDPAIDLFPDATGWITDHTVRLPGAVLRGRTYTLSLQIDSGAATEAIVGIDNVTLVLGVEGDIDGDGLVGVTDLLLLLGAWGPCPVPPDPCPADIDGDGNVGVTDLLAVLGNWTV